MNPSDLPAAVAAAVSDATAPIVVDGVFFQIGRSGIARVWQSLLALWAPTPFGRRLVVIDRASTAPRVPGIRYHDAAGLNYGDLAGDRRLVQQVCDEVGAALFISTYYSYPLTTPAMAMVYDMIPEVMGHDLETPMWRQKRAALAYADSFTAISHSTARDLARYAGRPVDVRVDYTGSDFEPVSADAVADFRRRHGIVRPYFMTSGSRADYKNVALFFAAFARFGDARKDYAIVCTGGGELDATSRTAAGEARVHIAIFDDHDLRCAYAGALALVYPSRYEGFGLPVLEAMACECPVITTTASSLPEVGGDAALYIELGEGDEAQTFELLNRVQRADVRAALVARGKVQARKFSWQAMADGVAGALQAVAAKRPAPAPIARTDPAGAAGDQDFQVGTVTLRLPAGHPLPSLQRHHPLFGRLPASLGAVLDDGDAVVVAGAGFGESVAALHVARPALAQLAIESDATCFAYLQANVRTLGAPGIRTLQATSGSPASAGIAAAVEAAFAAQAGRVRLVVSNFGEQGAAMLGTAAGLCAATQPMLLFPCQLGTDPAATLAWRQRLRALWAAGYAGFWLLDNFGNPLVDATTPRALDQALDYLQRQNQRGLARTVFYYDVLAYAARDAGRAGRAIESHSA